MRAAALAAGLSALALATPVLGAGQPASTVFDQLFPSSAASMTAQGAPIDLPFPFARLMGELTARTSQARIQVGLFPLGRSLHRHAAAPDYFASPRIVLGVVGDGGNALTIADRLYLGYQPAANSIEIISFDEKNGRFEFQEVTGYGSGAPARIHAPERRICTSCHQGEGPIFPSAPWSESNANPDVTANIVGKIGAAFQDIVITTDFDGIGVLNRSIARANLLVAAARLWQGGCGTQTLCRAQLLIEALRHRLSGGSGPLNLDEATYARFDDLKIIQAEIPDVDALKPVASGGASVVEPQGLFNPETRRPALALWPASADRRETSSQAAQLVGELLPARLLASVERELAKLDLPSQRIAMTCVTGESSSEIRFNCRNENSAHAAGFVTKTGDRIIDGRFTALSVGGDHAVRRVEIVGGVVERSVGPIAISLDLRQRPGGLHARLSQGARVSAILRGAALEIVLREEFTLFAETVLISAGDRSTAVAAALDGELLPDAALQYILQQSLDLQDGKSP